jgi:hypothetical protein
MDRRGLLRQVGARPGRTAREKKIVRSDRPPRVGRADIGSKNHESVDAGDAGAGDHGGQEREVANPVGETLGGETERVEAPKSAVPVRKAQKG